MATLGIGSPPALLISAAMAIQSLFGSATDPVPYRKTIVAPYVRMFETQSVLHGVMTPIPIGFRVSYMHDESIALSAPDRCPYPYRVIGYCHLREDAPPVIVIDREYFEDASEEEKISLIFHELGHCLLHRLHDDRRVLLHGRMEPLSLLYPSMEPGDHFWRFFDFYMDELFLQENPDPLVW